MSTDTEIAAPTPTPATSMGNVFAALGNALKIVALNVPNDALHAAVAQFNAHLSTVQVGGPGEELQPLVPAGAKAMTVTVDGSGVKDMLDQWGESVRQQLEPVATRIGSIEGMLQGVQDALNAIYKRLDVLESRATSTSLTFDAYGSQLIEIRQSIKGVADSVDKTDQEVSGLLAWKAAAKSVTANDPAEDKITDIAPDLAARAAATTNEAATTTAAMGDATAHETDGAPNPTS